MLQKLKQHCIIEFLLSTMRYKDCKIEAIIVLGSTKKYFKYQKFSAIIGYCQFAYPLQTLKDFFGLLLIHHGRQAQKYKLPLKLMWDKIEEVRRKCQSSGGRRSGEKKWYDSQNWKYSLSSFNIIHAFSRTGEQCRRSQGQISPPYFISNLHTYVAINYTLHST